MLGAACAASLKLFLVCVGIGWLLTEGYLPAETAPVLSKVGAVSPRPRHLVCYKVHTAISGIGWLLRGLPAR